MKSKILLTLILCCCSSFSQARDPCKVMTKHCTYDPRPAKDDFSMPMPGGLKMVFRKLEVPGKSFWGNAKRIVKTGDIQGITGFNGMFEGVQQLPITGSFYNNQQWYYYLGKYEVTVAQYLMVMGKGNQKEGLTHFYQHSANKKLIKLIKNAIKKKRNIKLWRALAQPISGISWMQYQQFIHQYSLWCYAHTECLKQLPRLPERLNGMLGYSPLPGFFRLPSEIEWEYAARGGQVALQKQQDGRPVYEKVLPFEVMQAKQYATVKPKKKLTRIGRWKATYGFYDLFGNVQELTANYFITETTQGKVGGLVARGGSYFDLASTLRTSLRREEGIYAFDKDQKLTEKRSLTSGIRLSIGSLVVQSERYKEDILEQYKTYVEKTRTKTTAGQTNNSRFTKATQGDLSRALDILNSIKSQHPQLKKQVNSVEQAIHLASNKIEAAVKNVTDKLIKNALIDLKSAGWHYYLISKTKKSIILVKTLKIRRKTAQIQALKEKIERHETRFDEHWVSYIETIEELRAYPLDVVKPILEKLTQYRFSDKVYQSFSQLLDSQLIGAKKQGGIDTKKYKHQIETLSLKNGVFSN